MISFIQTFLMVLAVELAGVAFVAAVLYVYWNCSTREKEAPVEFKQIKESVSSFSLIAPLVADSRGR